MHILAVDPGLTGALALLDPQGTLIALEDLPTVVDGNHGRIDTEELFARLMNLKKHGELKCWLEQLQAMPQNGSQASFSMGVTFGSILSVLQFAGIGTELVRPAVWKRALGLTKKKGDSLGRARRLYPTADLARAKDHNRAEALLLAWWVFDRRGGSRPH